MTLLAPGFLWLALLVPAALWFRRRRGAPAVLFAPGIAALPKSWRVRLGVPPLPVRAASPMLVQHHPSGNSGRSLVSGALGSLYLLCQFFHFS